MIRHGVFHMIGRPAVSDVIRSMGFLLLLFGVLFFFLCL
jgi:hypothetical protein